tara:strand:+ start:151 stop:666 length:516 start_codon:yes stop_codon:yes gene_type:complete
VQRAEKQDYVKQINSALKNAEFLLVADYKGLNVSEISSLRNEIKADTDSNFRVTKNTLIKRAIKDTNFSVVEKLFNGPTSVAYSNDPVSTSKVIVRFAKENENLKILGGVMGSQELSIDDIKQLASLPSMDEIRAKIVGLLVATQTNIVSVISSNQSNLVRLIKKKYENNN